MSVLFRLWVPLRQRSILSHGSDHAFSSCRLSFLRYLLQELYSSHFQSIHYGFWCYSCSQRTPGFSWFVVRLFGPAWDPKQALSAVIALSGKSKDEVLISPWDLNRSLSEFKHALHDMKKQTIGRRTRILMRSSMSGIINSSEMTQNLMSSSSDTPTCLKYVNQCGLTKHQPACCAAVVNSGMWQQPPQGPLTENRRAICRCARVIVHRTELGRITRLYTLTVRGHSSFAGAIKSEQQKRFR